MLEEWRGLGSIWLVGIGKNLVRPCLLARGEVEVGGIHRLGEWVSDEGIGEGGFVLAPERRFSAYSTSLAPDNHSRRF